MRVANRIAVVVAVAAVALAHVTPSRACSITIEVVSLWDRIERAERIVLAKPVCVTRPMLEVRPWMLTTAALRNRAEAKDSGGSPIEPTEAEILALHPELFEPISLIDHLVVEEIWKGTPVDVIRPAPIGELPCDDEARRTSVYFETVTAEGSWPTLSGFASAEGHALVRVRAIIARAVSLQSKRSVAEWRILDWLADAIAEPATRSAALESTGWGHWLFEGLEDPPTPAEAFEARHRDEIASGYLRDPGSDRDLPELLRILCGHSVPALEAAFDRLERLLEATDPEAYAGVADSLVADFLEALADDCGSDTADRWEDATLDAVEDIPIETLRRDLAAKRAVIAEEVLDAWERRVTGHDTRETAD